MSLNEVICIFLCLTVSYVAKNESKKFFEEPRQIARDENKLFMLISCLNIARLIACIAAKTLN